MTLADLVELLSVPHWAAETRKSARSAMRGFYGYALDSGQIAADPSRLLPSVRVPRGEPRPCPELVVACALAGADAIGRRMILLALLAGLRRSEIAEVHTSDLAVDLTGHSLRVTGKGGVVRTIPLHSLLAAELVNLPPGYVFPGKIDGHLSPQWVGQRLARLLGPGWSGHTLRHRFATDAYAVRHDLFAVQRLLGHSKPETTARYTEIPRDSLRAAVNGLRAA